MHTLLAVGVTILTATAPQAQPALARTEPLTISFIMPAFDDAIRALAQVSGVTIEFDGSVPQEIRQQPLADSPISMRDVKPEEAIELLTRLKGLAYSVVGEKTIRIYKKA